MSVSLDNQTFYNPAAATGRKPASRGPRVREGGPSAAIFGVPLSPPLRQNAHDPQCSSAGESQADAILIPSDDDDDLVGRSDTSFESLDELLLKARAKVESGRVTGTGNCVDTASNDNDVPEPSVTSGPGLDREFANQQQRLAGCAEFGPGPASAADNASHDATAPETDAASLADPAVPPQAVESRVPIPMLPGDESTSELEPADAEPRPQLQSPSGTAPGRGSGSCSLSQHPDHHDDDLASDPERRHPLVPEDREQDEDNTPSPPDHQAASKSTSEKMTQQQSSPVLAAEALPVKLAGILLNPGTRTTRRKQVPFSHDAKQGPGATRASSTEWPDGEGVSLQ
ncbi:hypothetical protein QBC38DRAFT_444114 [Podospora fimiseda]|uniref:Uncharacterized protein n=1 Tax=Podospora fimiseda TaxID=252190 RepID=A0AAN7BPG4_9PEZI|nr:hypothetical protein QBC38DRAFT_444114 [Podospora fimiseda]